MISSHLPDLESLSPSGNSDRWRKSGMRKFNLLPVMALVFVSAAGLVIGCAPAKWKESTSPSPNSSSGNPVNAPSSQRAQETFEQNANANKVDILIVNDNSASMDPEQRKMGQRFNSFISELDGVDYQIAMTTTDLDSKNWNQDGRILPWIGAKVGRVLTPSTPNAAQIFAQTVSRPETIDCTERKDCPSGNEQPLKALERSMDQAETSNSVFYRSGVDLVVVILSDEDEMSTAPAGATTAEHVVRHFRDVFGSAKRLAVHGLVILPGDTKCLKEQASQPAAQGYAASYGTRVASLASLTGGTVNSICDADYARDLRSISSEVRKLISSFDLREMPVENSISVTLTPAFKTTWKIEGSRLVFNPAPPAGTKIEVRYQY